MNPRIFELRLSSTHSDTNATEDLKIQVLAGGEWEPLELNTRTRGLLVFVYSAFICQHMYLLNNAGELGLEIDRVSGEFRVVTSEDWLVSEIQAAFEARLRRGDASPADVAYIVERMKNCPVSRNLKDALNNTNLVFNKRLSV